MSFKYPPVSYNQSYPPQGDPRRSQQVEELLMVFPTVTRAGDGYCAIRQNPTDVALRSILEYPFQLRSGHQILLRILLPNVFPEHPPRFVLTKPLNHPLVDSNLTVNLPMVRQWRPQYRLVDALIQAQELLSNVGQGQPLPSPPHHPGQASSSSSSSHGSNSPPDPQADTVTQFLQQRTDAELLQYVTDKGSYDDLVTHMAAELKCAEGPQQLEERIMQLVQQNLEREAEYLERKNQVAIVKSSDYANTKGLYETATVEYERLKGAVDFGNLLAQLQGCAQQLNVKTEELVMSALQGEIPAAEFIDEYVKLRAEHYEKDHLAKAAARLR